ncbi:Spectrin beta chain, non-erythrocytic 5 [Lemmus lemmus]
MSRCSNSYPTLAPKVPLFQDNQAPLPQPAGAHPFLPFSRQKEITQRWQTLLQCLQEQKKQISGAQAVLSLLQEVEVTMDQLGELQVLASSTASGPQLEEVALLLQRHDLLEAQVSAHRSQVNRLAQQTSQLDSSQDTSVHVLQGKALALVELHHNLVSLVRAR